MLDLSKLSVEEVTGGLKAVEDQQEPAPAIGAGGKLYLSEEEWLERYKKRD